MEEDFHALSRKLALGSLLLLLAVAGRTSAQAGAASDLPAIPPPPPAYQAASAPPTPTPTTQPAATSAQSSAPTLAPTDAAAASATSDASAPEASAPPAEAACVPSCRAGYFCAQGQCVSACNPACDPGQQCTANATCEMVPVAAPAPNLAAFRPAPALPRAPAGAEQHDGFMLRLTLGFGSGDVQQKAHPLSGDIKDEHAELSDFAVHLSLDLGFSPIDNLVLHVRLAAMAMSEPSTTVDGTRVAAARNSGVTSDFIGPAVSYYFMPIDLYLTAAVGFSSLAFNDGKTTRNTRGGPGLQLDVGKEFWVGNQWGLGAAFRFHYNHLSDTDNSVRSSYDALAWGILFSATYQ
jgi:hypothetical protein